MSKSFGKVTWGGYGMHSLDTGVDKGGREPSLPPNGRAKKFLVKIERLSSLPPAKSGRACHDNPTKRGYLSIRCPTCILV